MAEVFLFFTNTLAMASWPPWPSPSPLLSWPRLLYSTSTPQCLTSFLLLVGWSIYDLRQMLGIANNFHHSGNAAILKSSHPQKTSIANSFRRYLSFLIITLYIVQSLSSSSNIIKVTFGLIKLHWWEWEDSSCFCSQSFIDNSSLKIVGIHSDLYREGDTIFLEDFNI